MPFAAGDKAARRILVPLVTREHVQLLLRPNFESSLYTFTLLHVRDRSKEWP